MKHMIAAVVACVVLALGSSEAANSATPPPAKKLPTKETRDKIAAAIRLVATHLKQDDYPDPHSITKGWWDGIGTLTSQSSPYAGDHVQEVALQLMDDTDAKVRATAVQVLRVKVPQGAAARLARSLAKESRPGIYKSGVAVLSYCRSKEGAEALGALLKSQPKGADFTANIMRALGSIGQPEAAQYLLPYLDDPKYAEEALKALYGSASPNASLALIAFVKKLPDDPRFATTRENIRKLALNALWSCQDKKGFEFFLKSGGKAPDRKLPRIRPRRTIPQYIVDVALSGEKSDRQNAADHYLYEAVGWQVGCIHDPATRARWRARYKKHGPHVMPIIIDSFSDGHRSIRTGAYRRWATMGPGQPPEIRVRAGNALAEAAKKSVSVDSVLFRALLAASGPARDAALRKVAQQMDRIGMRAAVAVACRDGRENKDVRLLRRFYTHKNSNIRCTALLKGAAYFRDPRAGEPMLGLIESLSARKASAVARHFCRYLAKIPFDKRGFRADQKGHVERYRQWWKTNGQKLTDPCPEK